MSLLSQLSSSDLLVGAVGVVGVLAFVFRAKIKTMLSHGTPAPAVAAAAVKAAPVAQVAVAPVVAAPVVAAPPLPPQVVVAPVEVAPVAAPVVHAPPVAPVSASPQVVNVHGVNMRLAAPVSPDYVPSQTAWVFGHNPNTFVGEPSNGAKVGMPLRSPAGYPLVYAIGGDGKVVGTASVLQADQTFNSDAEVAAYNAKLVVTPEQAAKTSADWARVDAALQAQAAAQTPAPAPRTALAADYPNAAALTADIVAIKFSGAVTLDGTVINSGFGRADGSPWAYTTQHDGTVKAA